MEEAQDACATMTRQAQHANAFAAKGKYILLRSGQKEFRIVFKDQRSLVSIIDAELVTASDTPMAMAGATTAVVANALIRARQTRSTTRMLEAEPQVVLDISRWFHDSIKDLNPLGATGTATAPASDPAGVYYYGKHCKSDPYSQATTRGFEAVLKPF
jgi:hypothetical protein